MVLKQRLTLIVTGDRIPLLTLNKSWRTSPYIHGLQVSVATITYLSRHCTRPAPRVGRQRDIRQVG